MITLALLKSLFTLTEDGVLIWNRRLESEFASPRDGARWNTIYAGTEAGRGHHMVGIGGKQYSKAQIIFSLENNLDAFDSGNYGTTDFTLTKELLNERFEYRDGALYRKPPPLGDYKAFATYESAVSRNSNFDRAGTVDPSGYRKVCIGGKQHWEHKLIYIMHHGPFSGEIDHTDHDRSNNVIENLACVTKKRKFKEPEAEKHQHLWYQWGAAGS